MGAPDVSSAPGQPFYLSVMSHLAALAGDNDADFPKVLEEGVPLGMDSLTLRSPGIWPSKEELRGEDLEPSHLQPPSGRHNYESAETLAGQVEETFFEECALDLVEGPFFHRRSSCQVCLSAL